MVQSKFRIFVIYANRDIFSIECKKLDGNT